MTFFKKLQQTETELVLVSHGVAFLRFSSELGWKESSGCSGSVNFLQKTPKSLQDVSFVQPMEIPVRENGGKGVKLLPGVYWILSVFDKKADLFYKGKP